MLLTDTEGAFVFWNQQAGGVFGILYAIRHFKGAFTYRNQRGGCLMEYKFLLALTLSFLGGIGFVYVILRFMSIEVSHLDGHKLLLKLPLLGSLEVKGPERCQGLFLEDVRETLGKVKTFQGLMDFDLMLRYAKNFDVNYIGLEGDNKDGSWNKGRLAYSILSPGDSGGYNIFLNPELDRTLVCQHLKRELGVDIQPDELYTFLFLHEVGHTRHAGNKNYIAAKTSHRLSGKKRKGRKDLQVLYRKVEKFADDFATKELSKWRVQERGGEIMQLSSTLF